MLSFMQDNERDDSILNEHTGEVAGEELAEVESGEQDYLAPAAHEKNVKRSTIVLVVLFALGVMCIWFMIKKTTPKPAAAAVSPEEVQIENILAQLTGAEAQMPGQMGKMAGKFYQFSDVEQVGLNELKQNPFRHQRYGISVERNRREDLDTGGVKDLRLWSIMETEQGSCCMIADKILYEGDSIRGFEVVRIGRSFVELMSNGARVILKMPE
jgi:preprotein translocase subunit SecG